MDQGPLVTEEIDAGAEFIREFDNYAPVKVAFWLKASDEEYRYLYIASERIDATSLNMAYREVIRLAGRMPSPGLDPFRVKLIGAGDPLAGAAAEIQRRFPGSMPTRFGGTLFAGIVIDDIYIYPKSLPVTVA